jgi:DNA-binding response OmpR family regulator
MTRAGATPRMNITVVSYDQNGTDQAELEGIFGAAEWPLSPGLQWKLKIVANSRSAWVAIRSARIPLMVCGCDTQPELWKEMLGKFALLDKPPLLIVTSRLADDRLWVEALNLGAYDVLAKPYDSNEVVRTFSCAWLRWQGRYTAAAASVSPAQDKAS